MNGRPSILIVDDDPDIVAILGALLRPHFQVHVAADGAQALDYFAGDTLPDLVLLDILMPGMNGYDVCRRLKADARSRDIPVIFLTALTETKDEQLGFDVGAVDYITKPVSRPIVLARVRNHLALKAAADFLKDKNVYLEEEVDRRTREVRAVQDATIMAMATLAETRDQETGNHIRRTQNYVRALAIKLRGHPRFAGELSEDIIDQLFKSAPLHDIGKVGIPDAILLKPGKLTPAEIQVMNTHAALGRDAIAAAESLLDAPSSFLRLAREIAHHHHEKWDGSGFPEKLAGDAIPVSARLMALADVYDALISRRVYKPAFPHEQAVDIIRAGRGNHFDPDVADAFLDIAEEFRAIATRYADDGAHAEAEAGAPV
jgi:putative two-component system response regulator